MPYVDAYVLPVPRDKLDDYKAFTESMVSFWTDNGCTSYVECVGDDTPKGAVTSFPRSVQATDDEVVVFGWAVWPDKETRDAAGRKMREWPAPERPMPFDGGLMFWGGFVPFIERGRGA